MNTDAKIIKSLREIYPEGIAGTDLAELLGVTRGAIWARMDVLRSAGFEIEASPHHGYKLIKSPANLIGDDIISQLEYPDGIGSTIHVYRETTSTNQVAENMAQNGAAHGTVVIAESQTGGKGRMGRTWESSEGQSLLFSIILKPEGRLVDVGRLTLVVALAITKMLRSEYNKMIEIKWPNDLQFEGKKLAGILTEVRADMDCIHYAIIGVGININQSLIDFPNAIQSLATSLFEITGLKINRPALMAQILNAIQKEMDRYKRYGFEVLRTEIKTLSSTLGKWVELKMGSEIYAGRASEIDESGNLWIRTESGKLQKFSGGEVTTQKMMHS